MDASSLVSTKFKYLSEWLCHYNNYIDVVVDTNDGASMDEIYVTYADDEHVDNHDYDDNTDDDHDHSYDLYGRACNARVKTSIYIYIYIFFFFIYFLFSHFFWKIIKNHQISPRDSPDELKSQKKI